MLNKSILCSTLTVALLALAGCGDKTDKNKEQTTTQASTESTQSTQSSVATNKQTVLIGTEANFIPFRYRDGQNPEPLGFQIDVLSEAGKAANIEFKYVFSPNAPKLDILNQQTEYTATLATFDKTPENQALAEFSSPITTTKYMVHLKADAHSMGSLNDLQGKTISIDSYYASNPKNMEILEKLTGSKSNIVVEKFLFAAWRNMATGKTDGVFGEDLVLDHTINTHQNENIKVKMVDLNLPPNERSLLLKKGNPELLAQINQGIDAIKANGTYQKLEEKWFPKIK